MIESKQQLDKANAALFEKYGAFFAITQAQFDKQAKPGIEYTQLVAGLIVPSEHAETLAAKTQANIDEYHKGDLARNGKKNIIWRELANYECQINMSALDAIEALEAYGITEDEVYEQWPAYMQYCRENDLF